MRGKRCAALLAALCVALVSTGCWDATDINDKALITLVVTDRQDDQFVFYVEVPNLVAANQQENGGTRQQYPIVKGAGSSYAQARRQLDAQMDKPIFLGTVRALILTDSLAEHDIKEYFYRMQTMVDYRRALEVVTTRTPSEELLSIVPENNVSIGYSIDETVDSLKTRGRVVVYTVSDVLELLYSDQCFVLINIDVIEGRLAYTGYSIMRDGKLVGFIPLEESWGLVWLLGHHISRMYTVETGAYLATVKVDGLSKEITPHYLDGQVSFDIKMKFKATTMYIDNDIKFDERQQEIVKDMLQKALISDITGAINHSRDIGCDYLGFKDKFRVSCPNIVEQLDWTSAYGNALFNISVSADLDPGGLLDMEAQGEQLQ